MSRKMKRLTLATIVSVIGILVTTASMTPAFAATGRVLFIPTKQKYLTVEYYGSTIEIWLRKAPNLCSLGDIRYFAASVKDIINSAKSAYDAAKSAIDCATCSIWISATTYCAWATLPTVYGEAFCGIALFGVAVSCSSCGASLIVKILFPNG